MTEVGDQFWVRTARKWFCKGCRFARLKAGATHPTSIGGRAEVAAGSDDPAAKAAVRVTRGAARLLTESRGRDGSRFRSLFRKGMVLLSRNLFFRELERSKKFLRASRPALQRDGLTTEVVSS